MFWINCLLLVFLKFLIFAIDFLLLQTLIKIKSEHFTLEITTEMLQTSSVYPTTSEDLSQQPTTHDECSNTESSNDTCKYSQSLFIYLYLYKRI